VWRHGLSLVLWVVIVAPRGLLEPSPPPDPRGESLASAWQRAERRLAPATRQYDLDSINIGARGRINSTRDASRANLPWLPGVVDRTLSTW
jgi:hypothetical protein